MRTCKKCVLDNSIPELEFDRAGICNFCLDWEKREQERLKEKENLPKIIEQIKKDGQGKDYDILIGLSGGCDSSYCLHLLIELGLRPFCFTIDNGWNRDRESDENILKMVEKLKVPFYRYTIDNEKFNELYWSFIKGGIKNLEAISDHLIFATTYELADKYNIRWTCSGGNLATESIMPRSFGEEDPRDLFFIKSVYKKMIGQKLTGLPMLPLWKEQYYRLIKRFEKINLLDYFEYNRNEAAKILSEKYNWREYGEKHCESLLTWWFQNYYLPIKFKIDKRKAHFSSLICSGQMAREEALVRLGESPVYPKIGWEEECLKYPIKGYFDYPNSYHIRRVVMWLYKIWKFWRPKKILQ